MNVSSLSAYSKYAEAKNSSKVLNSSTADDYPIGPDNPAKVLNETWTAYWDDQAGAIYYYNTITGEATWIPPESIN